MTTTKRSLAKLLGPALLLTATLSVPAVSTAAPSPKDNKAHAADKWEKKDKQKAKNQKAKNENRREAAKLRAEHQRETAKLRAEQQREAAKLRAERQREAVKLRNERERVIRQPVYREPVYQPAQNRNRRRYDWDGWNRGRGTGSFRLDGVLFDQRHGCQLLRDHQGRVIPLVGFPLASFSELIERGDHVELYGRVQQDSACGPAFRVHEVERVWDARHRSLIFDRRRDGDFDSFDHGRFDRNSDRYGRYDDRYDEYDDRYDRGGRLISVDGRLGGSSRCPSLRTDDGEVFGLSGDFEGHNPGDHVRVIGFFENRRSSCGFNRTIVFDEINGR
jgi:hypothetical protein